MNYLFTIKDLCCSYDKPYIPGASKIALEIHELDIPRGKVVFIVGESGIGKSTILEVLGMMNNTIVPDKRTMFQFSQNDDSTIDLKSMWENNRDDELSEFRLKHFNFIFQSTNLMRNFTAYENIAITRLLQGYPLEESFKKAEQALEGLGIPGLHRDRYAQELSGGQQQRIAFARAIIPDFSVLFGDEPTGNLDGDNAMKAMELLTEKLAEKKGASAIIVSHDMHLAATFADIIIKVRRKDEHGYIDERSIFSPDRERKSWSNGNETFTTAEFETYLRKRI